MDAKERKIEDTKTFRALVRIGACKLAANCDRENPRLNHNVGENWFTPSFGDDDNEVILWDGQISCWGCDAAIAEALAELEDGCSFEEVWEALSDFENNV